MKKLNQFPLLLLCTFLMINIFSCSKEESQTTISENFSSTILAMESTFRTNIMTSTVYGAYNAASNTFKNHLINSTPDLDSRSKFQTWVTSNLSKTTFSNVVSAMAEYDAVVGSFNDLETAYSSFYTTIQSLHQDEITYILHGQYTYARPLGSTLTPCQSNCASQVEVDLDFSESLGATFEANPNPAVRAMGKIYVDLSIYAAVNHFNDCMNAC